MSPILLRRWGVRSGLVGVVVGGAITSLNCANTFGSAALAQVVPDSPIVPDNTLGAENSIVMPAGEINGTPSDRIDGGAIRDKNLFHSFQQFNIDEGRGIYFTNPTGVENILSRVTGNSASNILGKLGVLGNANLFLINPNGIIFGRNATLDVRGSFVGTTANTIGFGDRGFFNAFTPSAPSSLLTVNPSAFFFNQTNARAIQNQSRVAGNGLRVPDGRSLLLLGGNVSLDGGYLTAFGGRVDVGGVSGTGTVGLNVDGNNFSLSFPQDIAKADVSLTNAAGIDVFSSGGGNIGVLSTGQKL